MDLLDSGLLGRVLPNRNSTIGGRRFYWNITTELGVRAVTERRVLGVLTHAQVRLLGFVDREFYGGKIGPAMRAVTKSFVGR